MSTNDRTARSHDGVLDNLSYYEKATKNTTWSGRPLETFYGPNEPLDNAYQRNIADPGRYPYTRGIFPNMYRGRIWTRRELCGIGGPEETNERIKYLIRQGQGGPSVILDLPGSMGIDADHPNAANEVGLIGCSISSIEDMAALVDGIPMDQVSFSFAVASCSSIAILSKYLAVAQVHGIPFSSLKGTIQNDTLHARYNGFEAWNPPDLARKIAVDVIEFCTRHVTNWYPINVNLYDLREMGLTAAQEVAFGFAIALVYVDGLLARGLSIDDFGPKLAFYCSSHIDFFEEIAKLRAARRLWARIMKERYGAREPRSMQFRFGVPTAGCSLFPQDPLNNAIRESYGYPYDQFGAVRPPV